MVRVRRFAPRAAAGAGGEEGHLARNESNGEPRRPSPDDLLAQLAHTEPPRREGRGKLKIYLGAAPGVGKTYTMLNEARRLRAAGEDVVIGFVETHGRPETEAQIGELEIVPRRQVAYRGVTIDEMDPAAIIARAPAIALVDELAHTNAPGSARAKRYEDVNDLLAAGIDVIATVNVQHLDGLQDVINGITGTEVREIIPDRMLDEAEVQLVDLPTAALIERLHQGKVYPPQRAQQALAHYFRPGNLTALREMALRRTAAGVEDALTDYMHEHKIEEVWPASDHVLALIDGEASSGLVLRSAWRMASSFRSDLLAVVIVPPGGLAAMSASERRSIEKNIVMAEDLGSQVTILETGTPVESLVETVRAAQATVIVMRYTPQTTWRRLTGQSMVDLLFARLDQVNILLVEPRDTGG